MLAMAQLAIESDSTRIVTLMADAFVTPALSKTVNSTDSYHGLSHHGHAENKVRQSRKSTAFRWRYSRKRYREWQAGKRMASGCWIAPWCFMAAAWVMRI